jgi:hypothetical protein
MHVQTVEKAPGFFDSLRSCALQLDIAPGLLLRKVLPFDEDTSSNDQSAVSDHSCPLSSELRASCRDSGVCEDTLHNLRVAAMRVRRTIRVKMADEADLKQVRGVHYHLTMFILMYLNQAETAIGQLNVFRVAVLHYCDQDNTSALEAKQERLVPHLLIEKLAQT